MSGRMHPKTVSSQDRIKGFEPYVSNLDERMALYEAARCLMCYDPPCKSACPTGINIPEFIYRIKTGNHYGSAKVIRESNVFGGECGYVCPVERLCESKCVRNNLNEEPVAISLLQRFAYEKEKPKGLVKFKCAPSNKKKVAIIGAGPASLSAAYELARMGYGVTVCDSNPRPGGLMIYGILPWKAAWSVAESEIDYIKSYGVKVVTKKKITDVKALLKDYDAVFIGTGTTESSRMGIPGEELPGVYLAQDFLFSVAKYLKGEGKAPNLKGKRVAVIGGGDTAIDAACTSVRLGADRVYVVYRRSLTEMPAVPYGKMQAKEEGVEFLLLTSPVRIKGDKKVTSLVCVKMELGAPDESGRRSVKPIKGSEFLLDVDAVIVAVGQRPEEDVLRSFGVKVDKGLIVVNDNFATSIKGVYAGGDAVNGGETVVEAVAEGKKAAAAIDKHLRGGK
ncbi:MAG: NAD(P)-dependent oxidoreductase [Candidatus Verstraetearchaeota archaeon]|nr:NAD(P)-dependent oxidoreductase [Candidatus Verstraetearchaeota archaeon]